MILLVLPQVYFRFFQLFVQLVLVQDETNLTKFDQSLS